MASHVGALTLTLPHAKSLILMLSLANTLIISSSINTLSHSRHSFCSIKGFFKNVLFFSVTLLSLRLIHFAPCSPLCLSVSPPHPRLSSLLYSHPNSTSVSAHSYPPLQSHILAPPPSSLTPSSSSISNSPSPANSSPPSAPLVFFCLRLQPHFPPKIHHINPLQVIPLLTPSYQNLITYFHNPFSSLFLTSITLTHSHVFPPSFHFPPLVLEHGTRGITDTIRAFNCLCFIKLRNYPVHRISPQSSK